jgi:hypothetical protein
MAARPTALNFAVNLYQDLQVAKAGQNPNGERTPFALANLDALVASC